MMFGMVLPRDIKCACLHLCAPAALRLQWVMINRMIRLMWPKLTSAILLEVVKAVKPIVQQNLNAVSTHSN
jgi:hypothetical protein